MIINAEYYSNILLGQVKDKIQSKRKTGGNRIFFLQDNARPHTARKPMETKRNLKWELLPHTFLFWRFNSDLEGVRFVDNNAVISHVQEWVHTSKKLLGRQNKTVAKTLEKMCRSQWGLL